jgi:hypothetical protein
MLAYKARRGRLDSTLVPIAAEAQASFQLVYQDLEASVRLLLHAAAFLQTQSLVRGELSRHLAEACDGRPGDFDRRLDVCLDLHLLEGDESLRMHQLLASFLLGTEVPDELASDLQTVRRLQRDRFVELARQVTAEPGNRDSASALLTYPLSPSAWARQGADPSIEEGEAIGRSLIDIGQFEEARPWYERAVEAAQQGDVHGRIDHQTLGRSQQALSHCLRKS